MFLLPQGQDYYNNTAVFEGILCDSRQTRPLFKV
jgi:hypothetical protein